MMDTSLEKDYQASSVLRVYYEPPTSSTSEVELLPHRGPRCVQSKTEIFAQRARVDQAMSLCYQIET